MQFNSCPHTPALAIVCPREEWCVLSASAIATVIRSCRSHERSRRCRRPCAALETGCSLRSIPTTSDSWDRQLVVVVVVVVLTMVDEASCLRQHAATVSLCRSPRRRRTLHRRGLRKLALNSGTTRRSAKNGAKRPNVVVDDDVVVVEWLYFLK